MVPFYVRTILNMMMMMILQDKYVGFLMTAAVQLPGYVYVICTLERPAFGREAIYTA